MEDVINTQKYTGNPTLSIPKGRKNGERIRKNGKENKQNDDELFDIDFSKTIRELRLELEVRKREEERLVKDIAIIIEENTLDGSEQNKSFGLAVTKLNNSMLVVENQSKQLANTLKNISSLADTISGRVSALDMAKTRVVGCLQLASDMRDLGTCAEGIDEAIRSEDFEQASQHIHRFLTLDQAVFQIREFKDKDATDSIRHSYDVLSTAKERLSKILKLRMDEAVKKSDVAEMQRFVKLFPLLNEATEGLQRFGIYLNKKIEKLAEDNIKIMKAGGTDDERRNVLFSDTLFMFFEGVATIIESNLAILESSYGLDKLLDFMFILQGKIDSFFETLLQEFDKSRKVSSIVKSVNKGMRSHENSHESSGGYPDPLEIDVIATEICLMNTSADMYWRFVSRRICDKDDKIKEYDDFEGELSPEEIEKIEEQKKTKKEEKQKKMDKLLNRSLVGTKMQELVGDYCLLEHYYMQKSIEKAIKMDSKESADDLTSSIIDDIVFIIRKCIRRSAGSGNVDSVCATINNAIAMLDTTINHYFGQHIQAGYSTSNFATEALQSAQSAYTTYYQSGNKQAKDGHEQQKDTFILSINNTAKLAELLRELQTGLANEWSSVQRAQVEKNKLEHSTTQIEEAAKKLAQLAKHGVEELFKAIFKPKIRNGCDPYRDISHQLTMSDLEHFEAHDPFIEVFLSLVDRLLVEYEPQLYQENYQTILQTTCAEVSRQFENSIAKCQFNRYGALQLDREFRQISAYMTNVAGWTAREKVARLSQIVSILNTETVEEAVEVWQNAKTNRTTVIRALTLTEIKKILSLRVDFPTAAIKAIEN